MGRSRNLKIVAVLIVVAGATPSHTLATTGGVGLPGTTPSATTAAVADQLVTVSGEGITVSGHTGVLLSGRLWLKGTVSSAQSGRTLVIEQRSPPGSQWTQAGSTTIGGGGSFVAAWHPQPAGRLSLSVPPEAAWP